MRTTKSRIAEKQAKRPKETKPPFWYWLLFDKQPFGILIKIALTWPVLMFGIWAFYLWLIVGLSIYTLFITALLGLFSYNLYRMRHWFTTTTDNTLANTIWKLEEPEDQWSSTKEVKNEKHTDRHN